MFALAGLTVLDSYQSYPVTHDILLSNVPGHILHALVLHAVVGTVLDRGLVYLTGALLSSFLSIAGGCLPICVLRLGVFIVFIQ
jgi:hypothetical protein